MKTILSAIALSGLLCPVHAAGVTSPDAGTVVLGLPIGGKLTPAPKICKPHEIGSVTARMCWVDKPFVTSDGSRVGHLRLPNPEQRPEWAAHAMFEVATSKGGSLEWLSVKVDDGKQKQAIANSITKRFGMPVETTLPHAGAAGARWIAEGIEVRQVCDHASCTVRFAQETAALAARHQPKEARPATP